MTAVDSLLLENKTLFIHLPPEPPMVGGTLLVAQVRDPAQTAPRERKRRPCRRPSTSLDAPGEPLEGEPGPPWACRTACLYRPAALHPVGRPGREQGQGGASRQKAQRVPARPTEASKVRREGQGPHLLARPSRRRVWSLAPQHPRAAVRDTQTGAQGRFRTPVQAEGPVTLPRAAHGEVWWPVRPWEQL